MCGRVKWQELFKMFLCVLFIFFLMHSMQLLMRFID